MKIISSLFALFVMSTVIAATKKSSVNPYAYIYISILAAAAWFSFAMFNASMIS